jgi:hypothetical protein
MAANPFFRLKIARLKAALNSCASIYVKNISPDSADLTKTRILLWHIGQCPLSHYIVTTVICQWSLNHCANCQHWLSCFVREVSKACGPFSAALAVLAMVV